jgi:hypothetical protein
MWGGRPRLQRVSRPAPAFSFAARCGAANLGCRPASQPASTNSLRSRGASAVNSLAPTPCLKARAVKKAYTGEEFQQMLAQTSFSRVDIRVDGIGFESSIDEASIKLGSYARSYAFKNWVLGIPA